MRSPNLPGIDVFKPSHLHKFLGDGSADESGSAGSRDESHVDGSALTVHLAGDGVGSSQLVSPVSSSNWHDRELKIMTEPSCNIRQNQALLVGMTFESDLTIMLQDGNGFNGNFRDLFSSESF